MEGEEILLVESNSSDAGDNKWVSPVYKNNLEEGLKSKVIESSNINLG